MSAKSWMFKCLPDELLKCPITHILAQIHSRNLSKKGVPHSPYSRRQLYIHHRKNRLSTHRSISRNTAIHNQQSRHRTQCSRKFTNGSIASIKTILTLYKTNKEGTTRQPSLFYISFPTLIIINLHHKSSHHTSTIIHLTSYISHHTSHISHLTSSAPIIKISAISVPPYTTSNL